VTRADDLLPTLTRALSLDGPSLVEVPVDYSENMRLTEHLAAHHRPSEATADKSR
jgi:acetolactate synthase I/II/III large subunit